MSTLEVETRIKKDGQTERAWTEEWDNYDNDATWKVLDILLEVARQIGKSPAQVALNWYIPTSRGDGTHYWCMDLVPA